MKDWIAYTVPLWPFIATAPFVEYSLFHLAVVGSIGLLCVHAVGLNEQTRSENE